jgi:polysaccharide export outer membrane protein
MKQILFVLFVTCFFSITSFAQGAEHFAGTSRGDLKEKQTIETPAEQDGGYVIGAEDVLRIDVWREPELSTPRTTVRADGKISLLLLDDVQASGLTPKQLKEEITARLKKFLNNPEVYVLPLEIRSQFVYIVGSVAKTGVYPLGTSMRVTELLVKAGGLAEFAKSTEIVIMRKDKNTNVRYPFNYKTFLEGKDYRQDILLQSGDMVIVP